MCLLKRKSTKKPSNVASGSLVDRSSAWPSRKSNKVDQHDSSSSLELPGTRTRSRSLTPHPSKESQLSTSSVNSKGSLGALKEVVGDGAIVFQYKELRRATDGFSPSKKIGNSVYRGTVRNGMDVAITIHRKGDAYTDLVPKLKTLCSVHHSNVISMVGACATEAGDDIYAVYEFMEGARLRECLRSSHSPGFCVLNTWTRRLQIALDVAKGLEYLHDSTHTPLLHKYVKSNNILVDNDTLRAKIAQFGVAHLAGEISSQPVFDRTTSGSTVASSGEIIMASGSIVGSSSEIMSVPEEAASPAHGMMSKPRLSRSRSRKLTGTRGYMAPEYMKTGAVTTKLDVFAFGVVLLELLSGQEAMTFRPDPSSGNNTLKKFTLFEGINAILDDNQPRAKLRQWMDPLLKDSYPLPLAERVARLGKSCVETDPALRPEMRSIALDLSRIMMASERWEASMLASKDNMSRTMEAR